MFRSPCPLRSARCAALIALAAAAGIARTAPEVTGSAAADGGVALAESGPTTPRDQRTAPWLKTDMSAWLQSVVRWFTRSTCSAAEAENRPFGRMDHGNAEDHATAPAAPVVFPPPLTPVAFASVSVRHVGAGSHRWPHAVGPPATAHPSPPNAAGTVVPGDSAADGKPVLRLVRITPVDAVSSLPRLARLRVGPQNSAAPTALAFDPARAISASYTPVRCGVFAPTADRSFP